jgi:phenylacetate-coenzyme A ligase PaaK-like adenylate-forming protein
MITGQEIFTINGPDEFERIALEVFRYQALQVDVYRQYLDLLRVNPSSVTEVERIPFLPIQLFKTRTVLDRSDRIDVVFSSSGTTGSQTSKHHVADVAIYQESYLRAFEQFYGKPTEYCILALLPSYLEREGSSLVFMVDELIRRSGHPDSGFFLNATEVMTERLIRLDSANQKTILLGVTFALLDLAEKYSFQLQNTIVMETGGMKGRGKELTREELHRKLCDAFGVHAIHSEYGMTELLSQAYSRGGGIFRCPPWMRVLIRDPHDPRAVSSAAHTGAINIVDLANIHSCSFIQTDDLGRRHSDGSFEVLGRLDGAQLRGCNLLVYG